VQRRGGPIHELHAGDTVVVRAGEWQWHGAAPNASLVVVSTHETDADGTGTERAEHVTDAEYRRPALGMALPRQNPDRAPRREPCW
jgi:hypothetical protein